MGNVTRIVLDLEGISASPVGHPATILTEHVTEFAL